MGAGFCNQHADREDLRGISLLFIFGQKHSSFLLLHLQIDDCKQASYRCTDCDYEKFDHRLRSLDIALILTANLIVIQLQLLLESSCAGLTIIYRRKTPDLYLWNTGDTKPLSLHIVSVLRTVPLSFYYHDKK
jgi:hypothetical protein